MCFLFSTSNRTESITDIAKSWENADEVRKSCSRSSWSSVSPSLAHSHRHSASLDQQALLRSSMPPSNAENASNPLPNSFNRHYSMMHLHSTSSSSFAAKHISSSSSSYAPCDVFYGRSSCGISSNTGTSCIGSSSRHSLVDDKRSSYASSYVSGSEADDDSAFYKEQLRQMEAQIIGKIAQQQQQQQKSHNITPGVMGVKRERLKNDSLSHFGTPHATSHALSHPTPHPTPRLAVDTSLNPSENQIPEPQTMKPHLTMTTITTTTTTAMVVASAVKGTPPVATVKPMIGSKKPHLR